MSTSRRIEKSHRTSRPLSSGLGHRRPDTVKVDLVGRETVQVFGLGVNLDLMVVDRRARQEHRVHSRGVVVSAVDRRSEGNGNSVIRVKQEVTIPENSAVGIVESIDMRVTSNVAMAVEAHSVRAHAHGGFHRRIGSGLRSWYAIAADSVRNPVRLERVVPCHRRAVGQHIALAVGKCAVALGKLEFQGIEPAGRACVSFAERIGVVRDLKLVFAVAVSIG